MSVLRFTREQLIEALEARRPVLERIDADNLREHRKAEKDALKASKAKCRAALSWDYDAAKENGGSRYSTTIYLDRPSCPSSLVASLDRHLNEVKASRQKQFNISDSGTWSRVHNLLTYDPTIKSEMC